jgi:aconitate hydratase
LPVAVNDCQASIADGSIVIAAITSCTNTSNPHAMIGAGLLARKAVERGLRVAPIVKTSLAPGSTAVIDYLENAGLLAPLQTLGFHLVAFGCTTCIGNSGPLDPAVQQAIVENDLTVAAVLSGNRNFEARIHQHVKANFLASPMLVVALALAGRIDIDLQAEPLATDPKGRPVYLADLWPADSEIRHLIGQHVKSELYENAYRRIFEGDRFWQDLTAQKEATYAWDPDSTYIKNPPYFQGFSAEPIKPGDIENARMLLLVGDSVTTDHISPAGAIAEAYPAGQYLKARGIGAEDFNSYGSRRGNHEVMMRGTFANIRVKNQMVAPKEGSFTRKLPEGTETFIYDAAMAYARQGVPLVVAAGREYGTGSSRDWAAKGTHLLGVKAVLAVSFERIHRSNLVGMGVLPLVFVAGQSWQSLDLDGSESFFISGIGMIRPRHLLAVTAVKGDGRQIRFNVMARLDTPVEVDYFVHGGILPYVLRRILNEATALRDGKSPQGPFGIESHTQWT